MTNSVSLDFNGLAVFLTALFAILKLLGVVSWSWWIVFSPLILVYGLSAVILLIAAIWFLIYFTFKKQVMWYVSPSRQENDLHKSNRELINQLSDIKVRQAGSTEGYLADIGHSLMMIANSLRNIEDRLEK